MDPTQPYSYPSTLPLPSHPTFFPFLFHLYPSSSQYHPSFIEEAIKNRRDFNLLSHVLYHNVPIFQTNPKEAKIKDKESQSGFRLLWKVSRTTAAVNLIRRKNRSYPFPTCLLFFSLYLRPTGSWPRRFLLSLEGPSLCLVGCRTRLAGLGFSLAEGSAGSWGDLRSMMIGGSGGFMLGRGFFSYRSNAGWERMRYVKEWVWGLNEKRVRKVACRHASVNLRYNVLRLWHEVTKGSPQVRNGVAATFARAKRSLSL